MEELVSLKDIAAKIYVNLNAMPKFNNTRTVLSSMSKDSEQATSFVNSRSNHSCVILDWNIPIVSVIKGDGSIHICGNYEVTVQGC